MAVPTGAGFLSNLRSYRVFVLMSFSTRQPPRHLAPHIRLRERVHFALSFLDPARGRSAQGQDTPRRAQFFGSWNCLPERNWRSCGPFRGGNGTSLTAICRFGITDLLLFCFQNKVPASTSVTCRARRKRPTSLSLNGDSLPGARIQRASVVRSPHIGEKR
jgi:hypothetical protein